MFNRKLIILLFLLSPYLQSLLRHHPKKYYYKNTRKLRLKNLKRKKRKLIDIPGAGGGGDDSNKPKAKDDFEVADDPEMKVSGDKLGLVMRIDRPEESKPLYINMSPMYDFRKYV